MGLKCSFRRPDNSHQSQLKITDYRLQNGPVRERGAPVNGANLGSMGIKLSTKLINNS
jgi:hypothetical protein